ncbi:MAG: hypothetical protein ACYDEV_02690 [Acidiferrobacter sp.]
MNDDHFSPDDTVITSVRRALQNEQDVVLTLAGVGQILVCGALGEYLPGPMNDLIKFCTAPANQIRVAVLKPDEVVRAIGGRTGRGIDEFMWSAAFHASQGRLIEGCSTYDVVQFQYWPNLSRLPQTANTIRIVAMFTRYTTSITLARRLLKIGADEMYQIYSAAHCAGLARIVNGSVQEPVLKPHRNQSLLNNLLAKITEL